MAAMSFVTQIVLDGAADQLSDLALTLLGELAKIAVLLVRQVEVEAFHQPKVYTIDVCGVKRQKPTSPRASPPGPAPPRGNATSLGLVSVSLAHLLSF